MYATEKYVRFEIKEAHSQIHDLANDLGGDVRFLHQELTELREEVKMLAQDVQELKDLLNGS